MGVGRFEYLQSKITYVASLKPPGSQWKDVAASHSASGGREFLSHYGCESSMIHSSLEKNPTLIHTQAVLLNK